MVTISIFSKIDYERVRLVCSQVTL